MTDINHSYIFTPRYNLQEEDLPDLASGTPVIVETNYSGVAQFTEAHFNRFTNFLVNFVATALQQGIDIRKLTEEYFEWVESGHGPLCSGTVHFPYDSDYFQRINWLQDLLKNAWTETVKSYSKAEAIPVKECILCSVAISSQSLLFASLPSYVVRVFSQGNKWRNSSI